MSQIVQPIAEKTGQHNLPACAACRDFGADVPATHTSVQQDGKAYCCYHAIYAGDAPLSHDTDPCHALCLVGVCSFEFLAAELPTEDMLRRAVAIAHERPRDGR